MLPPDMIQLVETHMLPCSMIPRWCEARKCTDDDWRDQCVRRGWDSDEVQEGEWKAHFKDQCIAQRRELLVNLSTAIKNEDVASVRSILSSGTYDDVVLQWTYFDAVQSGNPKITALFHEIDTSIHPNWNDITHIALISAIASGHLEIVKQIIETGIDIHDKILQFAEENLDVWSMNVTNVENVLHMGYYERAQRRSSAMKRKERQKAILDALKQVELSN